MLEDIAAELVDDLLPDLVGVLDLVPQAESGIQGGKEGQPAEKGDPSHILCRDALIHDLPEKLGDQHGKSGGSEHQESHRKETFPIGL